MYESNAIFAALNKPDQVYSVLNKLKSLDRGDMLVKSDTFVFTGVNYANSFRVDNLAGHFDNI